MSFYIGKPNGSVLCHLTKGQHTIEDMKSSPFSDTVFHTDIQYMDFKVFPLEGHYSRVDSKYNTRYYYDSSTLANAGRDVKSYKITGELWDYLYTHKHAFILYDRTNNTIYNNKSFYNAVYHLYYSTSYHVAVDSCVWSRYPYDINMSRTYTTKNLVNCTFTSDRAYRSHRSTAKDCPAQDFNWMVLDRSKNIEVIVLGYKINGTLAPFTNYNFSGDVHITNSGITAGSTDITEVKYIIPSVINSIDYSPLNTETNNRFQLVNSVPKSTNTRFVSNDSETYIMRGGHKVFTSNVGSSMVNIAHVLLFDIPSVAATLYDNDTYTYEVEMTNYNFNGTEAIFLAYEKYSTYNICASTTYGDIGNTIIRPHDHSGNLSGTMTTYREGVIHTVSNTLTSTEGIKETVIGVNGRIKYRLEGFINHQNYRFTVHSTAMDISVAILT